MSDSSRGQLLLSTETVFNEVPATPVMQKLRFLKETIAHKNSTTVSNEIRSDRMRSDLILLGVDVAGAIDAELSYGTFDMLIEAAMCGTWGTQGDVTLADGVTTNASTTFTSATGAFTAPDVGRSITGTNIPPNTTISSVTNGTTIVLSNAATASGSALSFTVKARSTGNIIKNGVVNRSFLIEKGFLDLPQFFQFRGCAVNTWDLDVSARKIVMSNFGFMGAQATRSGATVSASQTAQTVSPPIPCGPQITNIETNTNMTGIKVKSLKFSLHNNLRLHDHVESQASDDFGRGVMDLTGQMDCYFKSGALYDQFLTNGSTSFSFVIADPLSGRTYTVLLPKIKLPDVNQEIAGVDADVMQTLQFRALYDSVTAAHLQITRT